MFSTVPAVRAALVDLFTATLDQPTDPGVFYGNPSREVPAEFVVVGSALDPVVRAPVRLPMNKTNSMDEDYELTMQVRTLLRSRNDSSAQRECYERSFGLLARLDDALRDPATPPAEPGWRLGGLVTWAYIGTLDLAEGPLAEGWESQITATVVVKAARI